MLRVGWEEAGRVRLRTGEGGGGFNSRLGRNRVRRGSWRKDLRDG